MKSLSQIENEKQFALSQIRASRPQLQADGSYVCRFCESSGDRGFAQWHSCDQKTKQGIDVRIVR
jgi:hypothetical protein